MVFFAPAYHDLHVASLSMFRPLTWRGYTCSIGLRSQSADFESSSSDSSALFLKSPETFRAYFGFHNSLYIFATPRFQAVKLRNPLSFSYIKNMLKDQLFKISRLQFDNWLFGPENFSGPSRNRPQRSSFRPYILSIIRELNDRTRAAPHQKT